MDLYKTKDNQLDSLKRESYELEKDIQSLVEKNVERQKDRKHFEEIMENKT